MVEKNCFVIAPIGDPKSDVRKYSDQVFKHIIKPSAESINYKPIRADQISEPGIITSQVIQHVVESPVVIADLTGHNPNVFYELAIRHAIGQPIVQMITKNERIPFDIASSRTIQFDIHDLDNVQETKEELVKQIKAIESKNFKMDTPISISLNLKQLQQSTDPEQRSLVDVIATLSELRSDIRRIEERFMITAERSSSRKDPHVAREMSFMLHQLHDVLSKKKHDEKDQAIARDILERIDMINHRYYM